MRFLPRFSRMKYLVYIDNKQWKLPLELVRTKTCNFSIATCKFHMLQWRRPKIIYPLTTTRYSETMSVRDSDVLHPNGGEIKASITDC